MIKEAILVLEKGNTHERWLYVHAWHVVPGIRIYVRTHVRTLTLLVFFFIHRDGDDYVSLCTAVVCKSRRAPPYSRTTALFANLAITVLLVGVASALGALFKEATALLRET